MNVPVLRFSEFFGEWEEKRLDSVSKIGRGKSKHRPRNASFLYGGKYPFIQTSDIKNATLYLTNYTQTYSEEGLKQSKLWDEETLCITIAANIAETTILKIKACFPDSVIGLIPHENEATVLFIKYLFDRFKIDIQRLSQGVAQDNLNQEKLSEILFNFPTIQEQQKIADFLTLIDNKINQLSQKKQLLERYKKGVMQQIFSQSIRFTDDNGREFPEWEVKKFGEIFSFRTTNSFSRENLNYDDGFVKNIHYGDIHTKFSNHFDITKEFVPFINLEIELKRIPEDNYCKAGDLIITDASEDYTDIGKCIEVVNLNNEKLLAGLHTILARPDLYKMYVGFSGYLMKSDNVSLQIKVIAQGSKVLSISSKRLSELKLAIPSLPEQTKIANFLTAIDNKIALVEKQLNGTKQYKKGLLQQLFV